VLQLDYLEKNKINKRKEKKETLKRSDEHLADS
jgi:hypothetical protein